MTLALNISIFIIVIIFILYSLNKGFKVVFIYGLLIFQGLTIIPSLIYIEEGVYISEQGRESYFVWATLIYSLYFIITFIVLFATFKTLGKVKPVVQVFKWNGKIIDHKIIFYVILFVMFILLLNVSLSKSPLFDTSITRFTYWENSKFPFLNKVLGNTSIFIPFVLGILYRSNKKKSIFLMGVYFAYNFMIGQKFSPIVSGLFSFFLPIVLMSPQKIRINWLFNKKIIFSFVFIFGLAYYAIYKRYEQRRPYAIIKIYDPNEAMFYRAFGLQGHLFWGATETYVYNDGKHSYNFSDLSQGMRHLMYKFAKIRSQESFDMAIKKGFNFTNAYPSILFYIYPTTIALIVHIVFTIVVLGFMGWLLMQFVVHRAYIMAVITYQLFNWTIYAFTMGYFYKLKYTTIFLASYAIFMVLNNKIKHNSVKVIQK
jgi:hypothetical protein